jgi:demethylmenaquinone methyltransferase/2-methoxy-6-polyprenyl-1,4-benzoquinol methylase
MARGRFFLPGLLYTGLLDIPLRGIRRAVGDLVLKNNLFPLLDLCCGPGTQARLLRRPGRTVVGLDINPKMVKYAASKSPGVPFVLGDAVRTPFRPGAFRGIIVSFALHEKEAAFRTSLLGEAVRILAPGGGIVLVDFERPWDRPSRLARLYISPLERLAGRAHFRNGRDFFQRGGLRGLLQDNDLLEVERRDIAAGTCALVLAVSGRLDRGPLARA